MKIFRNILVSACVLLGWTSCVNEEFSMTETRQGSISLSVDKVAPNATRAVETAAYPVAIYTLEGDEEKVSYERADQVPMTIKLPVGKYYAEAHTPGELKKIMDVPYYIGRDEFEILQNINTVSTVTCRMANGGVTVKYTDAFKHVFEKCDVTVDDGSQSVIIYQASEENGFEPITHYLCYAEKTNALYVNVVAITREGYNSSMKFTLTKKEAYEHYDDDKEYFVGGDCVVINCDTIKLQSTEGSITGITISANVSFEENEGSVDLDVEDFIPEDEDDNVGGSDSEAITLNLPENMVVSATTDPSLGDTYIAAEHGIKSIKVKMSSTSDAMMGSLSDLAVQWGVDFAAGAEVVDNQNMVALFGELGQTLAVPSEGDLEYTFPIGNFFTLLSVLSGEHTFTLTITDMEGNTKNGKLVLTVNN